LPHAVKTQGYGKLTKAKPAIKIKIELGYEDALPKLVTIRKPNDIFVKIYELAETIHTDQTGDFLVTLQHGYRYIMIGIHIDANYIFCETMKNRTEREMIKAYQKMVDRMQLVRQRALRQLQEVHLKKQHDS
jgi:hypothetical protein